MRTAIAAAPVAAWRCCCAACCCAVVLQGLQCALNLLHRLVCTNVLRMAELTMTVWCWLVSYITLASGWGVFIGVAALARLAGVGLSTTISRDSAPSKRDRFAQSGDFWFTPCFSEVGRLPPRDRKRPQQYIRRRPACLKLKFARGIMPTSFVADAAEDAKEQSFWSILGAQASRPSAGARL